MINTCRHDIGLPADHYTKGSMKRTLSTLRGCAALSSSSPASKRLGSQHAPVLSIEPDRIVIDELHLLLRIGDVPIRNLVFELVQTGRRGTNTISTLCSAMWGHLPSMGMQRPLWQAIRQVRLYISYGRRYEKGHQSLVITFQFLIEERHQ